MPRLGKTLSVPQSLRRCVLPECTINDVLHAGAEVSVHEKTATITLRLPSHCENEQSCQAVLLGMETFLRELSRENPHHLTVLEV